MNCFFCQNELKDTEGVGILDCPSCIHKTRYVCSGSLRNIEVWYVHVRVDPFLIAWDLGEATTSVYAGPSYRENNFLTTLDKMLPYSQSEVDRVVERFRNIKVFM